MSADMFDTFSAQNLLFDKFVYFIGDSNVRSMYKDLIWLLNENSLVPYELLRQKNELSFVGDERISSGKLHSGRDYVEERRYINGTMEIAFRFITRLNIEVFWELFNTTFMRQPDVIVLNSCLWDLTRWGPDGVIQYRDDIQKVFRYLKLNFPYTRIIWVTTPPPSFEAKGGFLSSEIAHMRKLLPWQVLFANQFASQVANFHQFDVLDSHYHLSHLKHLHTTDGIHWLPIAVRYVTNLLLTHLCLVYNVVLPGRCELERNFLATSTA